MSLEEQKMDSNVEGSATNTASDVEGGEEPSAIELSDEQAPVVTLEPAEPDRNESKGGESDLTLADAVELIAQLREGNRVMRDKYIRSHADFENFKRRMERDMATRVDDSRMSILRNCLEIVDNFDRALEAIDDPSSPFAVGVKMIHKQFIDFLSTSLVREIDTTDQLFDPYLHEALAKQPTNAVAENTITAVFQKGYLYKEKLLRAAQVKVAVPLVDETTATNTNPESPASES